MHDLKLMSEILTASPKQKQKHKKTNKTKYCAISWRTVLFLWRNLECMETQNHKPWMGKITILVSKV